MDMQVLSVDGKKKKTIQLNDEVFNREVSEGAIYHAIRNELANMRQGTAATKVRSQVKFSGRKPWRQKGTGRARAGSRRSPIWVGGGTIFGPQPRDYSYVLPRKLKRLAYKSILSQKVQQEDIVVVEDFALESGKTKDMVAILSKLIPAERAVLVVAGNDELVKRAGRNIPWLTTLNYQRLRAHDLFYGKKVVMTESAALGLNDFYAAKKA
ncbi:50S ribosomal protein L4 [Spirochaeta africana]|uniref:Large ribosomal subunit protein uL4 n=1 Tax=Spirochaeta africana (strain ATCC 700263 / DSM 8902 / Z-7692) TaxID=889378 RepID=H9UGL3_SPIAZ|nr:50S ribosomal protein L4 [Spirochaeta africana]AFG36656.1 50S ribosomal protein L4, bacterial/organelle [Spirochaeta africana DSM 8902]